MQFPRNDLLDVEFGGRADCLWRAKGPRTGPALVIAPPRFEVEGEPITAVLHNIVPAGPVLRLSHGVREFRWEGQFAEDRELTLEMIFRLADGCPVIRFAYALRCRSPRRLTKRAGQDNLTYLSMSLAAMPRAWEITLAEFNEMVHSYCLTERELTARHFDNRLAVMGPILAGQGHGAACLLAYEHGSQVPDAFINFSLEPDRAVALTAVKGNYYDGRPVGPETPYRTVWLHAASVSGDLDCLAAAYRDFILKHQSPNAESRKPYIFYNTWAFQERNKWWNQQRYLDSMNQERIEREIEVAHRIGIEVFVLDTGWYEKTGDWRVSRTRFPDGLASIRETLSRYGMRLGLWFNPIVAAMTSRLRESHEDCVTSWQGRPSGTWPIWETEESQNLCLVSRYGEAFAAELIRLVKEVGVTYFKWDAIGQYGCDDPGHWHGGSENSDPERAECYAFQLCGRMVDIVDQVCAACPEAIVDFDVTEGGRCVGLGFLAAGKYFLINNGPYLHNYDIPRAEDAWSNIFVHPGPARGWICRTPLSYDRWIPSVLFLTHYLPDDPADSQLINVASLILGQNGIWGDLLGISEEGVNYMAALLGRYKQVRDDLTGSFPVRAGAVGGSPEVHEKISAETGRGAVVAFSCASGQFSYVTANRVHPHFWHTDGVARTFDDEGRARLELVFEKPGARIVFFGVD